MCSPPREENWKICMKEEDDMLELLDEEDLGSDSSESEELELIDDSTDESLDSQDLEQPEEEAEISEDSGGLEVEESVEPEEEGIVIDVRYIAVAVIAIAAILLGVVFFVLPMMADNPPAVTITSSVAGEDLFLTHNGVDSLSRDSLTILINGAPVPADKYNLMGGAAWPWSTGTVLRVDTSGYNKPATVTLVYKPKSTEHTIFGTTVEPTPTPTPTPEPVITPNQTEINNTTSGPTLQGEVPAVPIQQAPVSGTMVVTPVAGSAPLTVQCTDQTSGCVRNRVWNFGDGQTSMKRSPTHVFPYPGIYNVSLDVRYCDPDDNPSELPVQNVVVAPSDRHDTLSSGTGIATILPGAKLFFTVKGPGTTVRIGGRDHNLKSGDLVQLTLGSGGNGDISVISKAILRCNYNNVTMSVNGEEVETGTISVINIDRYLEFETADLTIQVITGRDGAKGMVDAQPVISATPGQMITFSNVGTDSSGQLLFSVQDSAGYSFRGGIGSHEIATPPPL